MRASTSAATVLGLLFGCSSQSSSPDAGSNGRPLPVLPAPPAFVPDDARIPATARPATPLLNEVRWDTAAGDPQLVEVKGASGAALELINERGATVAIPAASATAAGFVVVWFDGPAAAAPGVLHVAPGFLGAPSGLVALRDAAGKELDRVSWGADRADAVQVRDTGLAETLPGSSLVRQPQSVSPFAPGEWFVTVLPPTAGLPNRNLMLTTAFPLDGSIVLAEGLRLSWPALPGPTGYHAQVASDVDFTSMVMERSVAAGPVELTLPEGGYYWRVQPTFSDGSSGDWSAIQRFIVVRTEIVGDPVLEEGQGLRAAEPAAPPLPAQLTRPVPMYLQHKDSLTLNLESDTAETRHGWNNVHPDLDEGDPADNQNCARASISMVNGFFDGAADDKPALSQDRIGMYVFREVVTLDHPGPELDLGHGRGLFDDEITRALTFALGAAPEAHVLSIPELLLVRALQYPPYLQDRFWSALGGAIAADRPVLFTVFGSRNGAGGHTLVATGRYLNRGKRYVKVNDPWTGRKDFSLEDLLVRSYWLMPTSPSPRRDEPDLVSGVDTDGDGLIDFDEDVRFGTNKRSRDSDMDCLDDLAEVRASVFNPKHGWGVHYGRKVKGLPEISDGKSRSGKPPETDGDTADSDGGGLDDTMEDLDRDGMVERELGETDPQDPADDRRRIRGHHRSTLEEMETENGFTTHFVHAVNADLDLSAGADGKLRGTAHVRITWDNTRDYTSETEMCRGPRHDETHALLEYDEPVEATFQCQGLKVRPLMRKPNFDSYPATFTDSCTGTRATSISPFGTWGGATVPPFDERPLDGSVVYRQSGPVAPGSKVTIDYDITVSR